MTGSFGVWEPKERSLLQDGRVVIEMLEVGSRGPNK